MTQSLRDTDFLLDLAAQGDRAAWNELLARYHGPLRNIVAVYLDPRIRARVDPSDVVVESMAIADRRLADYLQERKVPFLVWLRGLAKQHAIDLYREHVEVDKRSVNHEVALSEESMQMLADGLRGDRTNVLGRLEREEVRHRVRTALGRLSTTDREVIVLRNLEQLTVAETAEVLGIKENAVKQRHHRAILRLGEILREEGLQ
jgi:RNA polymerase sigma-70 factor (ECF subfamily)